MLSSTIKFLGPLTHKKSLTKNAKSHFKESDSLGKNIITSSLMLPKTVTVVLFVEMILCHLHVNTSLQGQRNFPNSAEGNIWREGAKQLIGDR